jgi:hypothetical protein
MSVNGAFVHEVRAFVHERVKPLLKNKIRRVVAPGMRAALRTNSPERGRDVGPADGETAISSH